MGGVMSRLRTTVATVAELFAVTRTVVGTIWFWIPLAYALYFMVQLWLIFFVHPLTAFAAAVVLGVYAVRLEGKRTVARYALKKTKTLSLSPMHLFVEGPQPVQNPVTPVEELVEEYGKLLKKANKFSS
jgi:hypothetical protein